MSVVSEKSRESMVADCEDGVSHSFTPAVLEMGGTEVKRSIASDAHAPVHRLEVVWDKICDAAGRTC
jgi:hypothetical protein